MPVVTAVVVACDHFLPQEKDQLLHEFHVVVRLEDTGRCVRLRTDRGEPIRLVNMLPPRAINSTREDLEAAISLFKPGRRLRFMRGEIPHCRRDSRFGYSPIDVAVDPRAIEILHNPAPRVHLRLIAGGRA